MKRIYEKPQAIVTTFESVDAVNAVNAVVAKSVATLGDTKNLASVTEITF